MSRIGLRLVCSGCGAAGSVHIVPNWHDSRGESGAMKHVIECPFANPEAAARQLLQLTSGLEAVQNGRMHIEKIDTRFMTLGSKGTSLAPASVRPSRRVGSTCT
ncbi:hypothetical protein [Bradyrhizobium sp. 76]|uniref:hypothetical protein n=1 Tax=Bradyrhizobium sp. 76 TaxID=2782680 RepID=UPI001FFB6667|nr:hypothetical protein [Bradyrhizobium sp. 76]MCK1406786.1 hypothetical protein [Bradyrhizobium sp. 76]